MDVLRGWLQDLRGGGPDGPNSTSLTPGEMVEELVAKHHFNFPFVKDLRLEDKLGDGAMGEVFLATMGGMGGARVAAKRPSEDDIRVLMSGGKDAQEQFIELSKEYINLAKVGNHQNVDLSILTGILPYPVPGTGSTTVYTVLYKGTRKIQPATTHAH